MSRASGPDRWRRAGVVVVVALAIALVVLNRAQVPAAWRAAGNADPGRLAVGGTLSLVSLAGQGLAHRASQRSVGLDPGRWRALELGSAAHFLNTIAKSGGLAGLVVFTGNASRRGVSRGPVVAAYLLTLVLTDLAFGCTVAVGIVLLATSGRLSAVHVAAALVFGGFLASRITLFALAARSPSRVRRLSALPDRVLSRVGMTAGTGRGPSEEAVDGLFDAVRMLRRWPAAAVPVVAWAVGCQAAGVVELAAVLAAVGGARGIEIAIMGYAMSLLFGIVGFLPGGIGFAEVSLGAVLVSFGSTVAEAAAAVALFRIFQLWLPAGIGALAAHHLRREPARSPEAPSGFN